MYIYKYIYACITFPSQINQKYRAKRYSHSGGAAASPPPPLGGYMCFIYIFNRKIYPPSPSSTLSVHIFLIRT